MNELAPVLMLVFFVILAAGVWFGAMSMDKSRIEQYVRRRGGRIISINWAPFGKGWFGERNARIYEVVYYDRDGNQRWATCKTSMLAGVYWTDDRITHRRERWFADLPAKNLPGDPFIAHVTIDDADSGDRPGSGDDWRSYPADAMTEEQPLDDQIENLERRLEELRRRRRSQDAQS